MGMLAELRQRGAASSLVEELRLESAKSARLEKIISKLMGELRAAKLHAAATGGGGTAADSGGGARGAILRGAAARSARG